jgi:hypothetical protein
MVDCKFFAALWAEWLGRMSTIGSLVFLLLGIFAPKKWQSYQRPIFLVLSAIFFFLACQSAWEFEHEKRIKAEAQPTVSFNCENTSECIKRPEDRPTSKDWAILEKVHTDKPLENACISITRIRNVYDSHWKDFDLPIQLRWYVSNADDALKCINITSDERFVLFTGDGNGIKRLSILGPALQPPDIDRIENLQAGTYEVTVRLKTDKIEYSRVFRVEYDGKMEDLNVVQKNEDAKKLQRR